ncbi:MAG: purine-nucleoside phosphorylase [Pseudomonadota bacterium]
MSNHAPFPDVDGAIDIIRSKTDIVPHVAIILGSGLGALADAVQGVALNFSDLPGFPHAGVSGHKAQLLIGHLSGVPVAVLSGRAHYYENGRADAMRGPLEALSHLGAKALIATNACGALQDRTPPGALMLIADHINYAGISPLVGEATDARFVNLTEAYDPDLRGTLKSAARAEDVALEEGIYAWYPGPNFETPAEIRALRILGADAVGMSTVPEVILARFLGLRCAAISVVTNKAAGLGAEHISHSHTKDMAPIGAEKLTRILARALPMMV